ncbi:hypothetical protein [Streptomyces sp. NPDC001770]
MRAGDRRSSGWRLGEENRGGTGTGAPGAPDGGAARRAARLLAGALTVCAVLALYLLVLFRGDLT